MNIKFTDVLKTMLAYLRVDSLLQYKETYDPITDYVDNTIPSWINVKNYVGNISDPTRISFTTATGYTINWQTDLADGTNTFYQLFGDVVEAFVYTTDHAIGQPYSWTLDGSNHVNVVTFDWGGDPVDGYIRFN